MAWPLHHTHDPTGQVQPHKPAGQGIGKGMAGGQAGQDLYQHFAPQWESWRFHLHVWACTLAWGVALMLFFSFIQRVNLLWLQALDECVPLSKCSHVLGNYQHLPRTTGSWGTRSRCALFCQVFPGPINVGLLQIWRLVYIGHANEQVVSRKIWASKIRNPMTMVILYHPDRSKWGVVIDFWGNVLS